MTVGSHKNNRRHVVQVHSAGMANSDLAAIPVLTGSYLCIPRYIIVSIPLSLRVAWLAGTGGPPPVTQSILSDSL